MRSTPTQLSLLGVIVFACSLRVCSTASAQTPSPSPSPTPKSSPTSSLEKQFFKNILSDQKAIWTSPFHLKGNDAQWLIPLGWSTAALIATDRTTGDKMAESTRQLHASRIISQGGATYTLAAAAGTFYLVGRAQHNSRARETGILSAEALIDSVIVVTALKEITQRARPSGGANRSKFFVGGSSFPSGHSIQVWSVATVVANEYHDRLAVQIAAYGIASAVAVSRFTGRRHYLSDILVGSALGYGIGRYVYRAHHVKNSSPGTITTEGESQIRSRWPAIMPEYERGTRTYGVALAWSF